MIPPGYIDSIRQSRCGYLPALLFEPTRYCDNQSLSDNSNMPADLQNQAIDILSKALAKADMMNVFSHIFSGLFDFCTAMLNSFSKDMTLLMAWYTEQHLLEDNHRLTKSKTDDLMKYFMSLKPNAMVDTFHSIRQFFSPILDAACSLADPVIGLSRQDMPMSSDLTDEIIDNVCMLAWFSRWENLHASSELRYAIPVHPDKDTICNIKILVSRVETLRCNSGNLKHIHYPIPVSDTRIKECIIDYISDDVLWSLNFSSELSKQETLNLLLQWILGKAKKSRIFDHINKLRFFNPYENLVQQVDIRLIPVDIINLAKDELHIENATPC